MKHNRFITWLSPVALLLTMPFTTVWGQVTTNSQLWTAYQLQANLPNQWQVLMDLNFRTQGNFINENFQDAVRAGVGKKLSNNISVAGGYAYFRHYRPRTGADEVLPEHRGWVQLICQHTKAKSSFTQRLRLENRHILRPPQIRRSNDEVQSFGRLRYQMLYRTALSHVEKNVPLWWFLQNELMVHAGESIQNHFFDQNRLFAGIEIGLHPTLIAQVGYMHLIQYQPIQERWRQSHVVRFNLRHQLSFVRKTKAGS